MSEYNREFQSFLSSHGIESEFEYPIEKYNFDLHIKESNILIELDPSVTHNVSNLNNLPFVSRDYHLWKSEAAERNNFRCIHVFDWDDWNKILMLIQPEKKVYARQCVVKQIDQRTADLFTNHFHIQGKCRGQKTNFGLYFNQELIEVMTFGTPRYAHKYKWELLRLCTKPGVKVTGGASKLFKYALKEIPELDHVISYCDKSKFNGAVYSQIGFQLIRTSEPQEIWSKENKYITANMLQSRGFDQLFNTTYGKGADNNTLMLQSGWLPVFDCRQWCLNSADPDCGQYVYIWNRT